MHFVLSDLPDYRFYLEELSDQVSAYGKEGSGSQGIVHNNKMIAFDEYDEILNCANYLINLFKDNDNSNQDATRLVKNQLKESKNKETQIENDSDSILDERGTIKEDQ